MAFKQTLFNDSNISRNTIGSLNYGSILQAISNFRKSAGKTDFDGIMDVPQLSFFKLFFYFDKRDYADKNTGFLAQSWDINQFKELPWETSSNAVSDNTDSIKTESNHTPMIGKSSMNTALNYLLMNNEWERAEKLVKFIKLLQNISCLAPWYFQKVSGVEDALKREYVGSRDFKINEERKSIEITCLPDPIDNRIGTLLDLYRDIVASYQLKKEIVPANLRKFDMGLYVFSSPKAKLHFVQDEEGNYEYSYMSEGYSGSAYKTSYKYIEFKNCEFDYNNSTTGYNELNNADGTSHEFKIKIFFDDAYESRYNESLMRKIGDFCIWDINYNLDKLYFKDSASSSFNGDDWNHRKQLNDVLESDFKKTTRIDEVTKSSNVKEFKFFKTFGGQILNKGVDIVARTAKRLAFGNLFGIHPTHIVDQGISLLQGNVLGAVTNVMQYKQQAETAKERSWKVTHLPGYENTWSGRR